jgi:hypothetical protein
MGLFSLVTLLAHEPLTQRPSSVRQAAWYVKSTPTFLDALALVRRSLWAQTTFHISPMEHDVVKVPRALVDRFCEMLCYAA